MAVSDLERKQGRAYRAKHRERIRAKDAEYYAANADRVRARVAERKRRLKLAAASATSPAAAAPPHGVLLVAHGDG